MFCLAELKFKPHYEVNLKKLLKIMVLNFKTLGHEIAAVKNYGVKNWDIIDIGGGELQYTSNLLYPIADALSQTMYTESKQTLAELQKRKKEKTKWTCTYENCGASYNSA